MNTKEAIYDHDHIRRDAARSKITLSRSDSGSANVVEVGVRLQAMLGTIDAVIFLESEGIALEVAARVLSHPNKRRQGHVARESNDARICHLLSRPPVEQLA